MDRANDEPGDPGLGGSMPNEPELPTDPILEAQAALAGVAEDLLAIDDRLRSILARLPHDLEGAENLEEDRPTDTASTLVGLVECVLHDRIRPAIETLERAGRIDEPP